MKTGIFAILIAFVLVFIYQVAILIVGPFLGGDVMSPPGFLQVPLNLARIVYNAIPNNPLVNFIETTPGLLQAVLFFMNVFFYSIPVYVLLRLIFRRKPGPEVSEL